MIFRVLAMSFLLLIAFTLTAPDVPVEEVPELESDEESVDVVPVDPTSLETTKEYQNENIHQQEFDHRKWNEVVGETDYIEDEYVPPSVPFSLPWLGQALRIL